MKNVIYPRYRIRRISKRMPIAWLKEIEEAALPSSGPVFLILTEEEDLRIKEKYKGYRLSNAAEEAQADPQKRISGCCDRADQY